MKMWHYINKSSNNIVNSELKFSLFIFIFMLLLFNIQTAIIYFIGVTIGLGNFLLNSISVRNWLINKRYLYFISTFLRIFIVAAIIIFFVNSRTHTIAYVSGLVTHYLYLFYFTISKKGSA